MKENTDGWITHNGGECPIPDAKAGEYEIKFRDWDIYTPKRNSAKVWEWKVRNMPSAIIAYRLIEVQK